MLSCLGFGRSRDRDWQDDERQPLLPRYNDNTALQTRLHEKLHTYQMLRALSQGSMPSNEQTIIHLRTLLSANILNPDAASELSESGQALIRTTKLLLQQLMDLLQHKNSDNQIQDFIWCLAKAQLSVDTSDISARAAAAKAKADTKATYRSIQTVGSLLLNNSDFRVFLSDLSVIGREVFRDTAFSLADATKQAGQQLEPSQEEQDAITQQEQQTNSSGPAPTKQDLEDEVRNVSNVVAEGAVDVAHEARDSITEHVSGEEQAALAHRLKQAVFKLRQRPDYSESVSTLALLLQRYLLTYSHAAADTAHAIEQDVETNPEVEIALQNFWKLITSFGSRNAWIGVETAFKKLVDDGRTDPNFDELTRQLANLVQNMLSNPGFFDDAENRFQELRDKSKELLARSSIASDVETLFIRVEAATKAMGRDDDIHKMMRTSQRITTLLSPAGNYTNGELVTDAVNVFLPLLVQAVQYLPIPRLEVSTPAVDLLLENLILEPGRTVNNSSFLPFKLHVSTQNDFEIRKARFRTTSSVTSLATIKIAGLSLAADDLGYWFKLHSGLLRMTDEGLAGFHLDERGIDITLDVEIARDRLEKMVSLRKVHVDIHRLNYTLSESKFACLAWLFKPLIRPIVRKALEMKIATAISDSLHMLNRELLYARERLRATRIAGPDDLWTFVRAVAARLAPEQDPDVEARVGVRPSGSGVFRGRYAPGSLVQLWEREGRQASQRVYEYERGGWRNDIFDVKTVAA